MPARPYGHRRISKPPVHRGYAEPHIITMECEEEVDSKKSQARGKKAILRGLIVLFIITILIISLYNYILPRVDVEFITVYHESTGGASSGGLINVNTLIKNSGTKSIEDINMTLEVTNSDTGELVASTARSYYSIHSDEKEEPFVEFMGDHYNTYNIDLKIEFTVGGKGYFREYSYSTGDKEAMNIVFEDEISEWAF